MLKIFEIKTKMPSKEIRIIMDGEGEKDIEYAVKEDKLQSVIFLLDIVGVRRGE